MKDAGVYQSWGRYPVAGRQRPVRLDWLPERLPSPATPGETFLPYGLGRSYGDSCLNEGGALLVTDGLNRFLAFDPNTGLVRCEAGVSLDAVLRLVVPRGWFLPTTPGTKFVTVGGAVANDVHGKNHHRAGTFGCHVTRFELLRSDGSRRVCSREGDNADWFRATVGGLGLTGLITWVEFRLRKIESAFLEVESTKFGGLDEFFDIARSDHAWEHTVAWVDCLARGRALGRGIYLRGNHAPASPDRGLAPHRAAPLLAVPFDAPTFALNTWSLRAFNTTYFHKQRARRKTFLQHYDPFFYPLDKIAGWNRIYGRRGFFQYQCALPPTPDHAALRELFARIAASGRGSFLAVLKTFGVSPSPGLLSFPRPGPTLALDFPNEGARTLALFRELDTIVRAAGGVLYPAKDARMSAADFQAFYPQWHEFQRFIDPHFSSCFWRRVAQRGA